MPWTDVIGQPRVTDALARAVESGRVAHAYLFHGPAGTGTRAAALAFAQALQCERRSTPGGPIGDACGVCLPCTKVARLLHPDVHVFLPYPKQDSRDVLPDDYAERLQRLAEDPYAPVDYRRVASLDKDDGPSNKQVEHRITPVNERIRRAMTFRPAEGVRVVGILTDADRMRTRAANAFLKLLEEPSPDVVLILTAERVDSVLPTILSRCQRLRFDPLVPETVEQALVDRAGADPKQAAFIARMADGSYMRALELLRSKDLQHLRELALAFMRASFSGRPLALASLTEEIARLGRERMKSWLSLLLLWVRDLVLARTLGAEAPLVNADQAEAVQRFVSALPEAELEVMMRLTEQAIERVESNANAKLVVPTLAYALQDAMRGGQREYLAAPLDMV